MHLFLQICGVVGFGLLGFVVTDWNFMKTSKVSSTGASYTAVLAFVSFALISTYFIFG